MKYGMNTTGSATALDKFAKQENKMFIRIFYNGKFVNYFFDPADVENIGLSNIFDMIDPDPDFVNAQANWGNFQAESQKRLAGQAKKKQGKLAAAK